MLQTSGEHLLDLACMHIMASQVQAGNIMIMIIFIDISQKIRELTEVIHTFVCVAS